jgi:hypothetical protein
VIELFLQSVLWGLLGFWVLTVARTLLRRGHLRLPRRPHGPPWRRHRCVRPLRLPPQQE